MEKNEIKKYIFDNIKTLNIKVEREIEQIDEEDEEEIDKFIYFLTIKENDKEENYEFFEEELTTEEITQLDKLVSYFSEY